jgi:predicted negative regulator of RcsB-dependent stress response
MKKTLLNNTRIIIISLSVLLSLSSFYIFAQNSQNNETLKNIEILNISSKMIEDKKFEEAKNKLSEIKDVDFYFLKNQQLGDIAFLNGKYEEALSFYNIAQIHAKDKIMFEYMNKKMDYIKTLKIKK